MVRFDICASSYYACIVQTFGVHVVCMYVCACMCVYMYARACVYMYARACVYMYVRAIRIS